MSITYGLQNCVDRRQVHIQRPDGTWWCEPWDGKDAVDAVVLMYIGFDKLRDLGPTERGHHTITMAASSPTSCPIQVRSGGSFATPPEHGPRDFDKLVNIGRDAELMTDATWKWNRSAQPGCTWQQSDRRSGFKKYRKDRQAQMD